MELGLWFYSFYSIVAVPAGSGVGATLYAFETCNTYEPYTPIDPTWKTAQAFAIITFIFGIFTLVSICVTSCVTNCYTDENGYPTTYGYHAPLCLFTAICQGLVLLLLGSNACNSKVLIGLGGRQTWDTTFNEKCSLSTGANLVISATVFWFCAAVTHFMANKVNAADEGGGDTANADSVAKKVEEGEAAKAGEGQAANVEETDQPAE